MPRPEARSQLLRATSFVPTSSRAIHPEGLSRAINSMADSKVYDGNRRLLQVGEPCRLRDRRPVPTRTSSIHAHERRSAAAR